MGGLEEEGSGASPGLSVLKMLAPMAERLGLGSASLKRLQRGTATGNCRHGTATKAVGMATMQPWEL